MSESARKYHQRTSAQQEVLSILRNAGRVVQHEWQSLHPGSRLAPVIDKLRNAHGFMISLEEDPTAYVLENRSAMPTRVEVSDTLKLLYYKQQHWLEIRKRRAAMDGNRCVICKRGEDVVLQCHHITYERLFRELITDLFTVCSECHKTIHDNCRLMFPAGMEYTKALELLPSVFFPKWALPKLYEGDF